MYRGKKILGLIPARAGSKGIIHKNMALFCGYPLIYWTVKSAKESVFLDEIVVSTDGKEIAAYSKDLGVKVIMRPKILATDTSKTIECVMHALAVYAEKSEKFDYVMILQPTAPLRRTKHIDDMIKWLIDCSYDNAVSISPVLYNPVLMRYKQKDKLINVLNQTSTVRRQDMKTTYYVDGCLYLYKTEKLSLNTSLNDAEHGFLIDRQSALDINTPEDLHACEVLLSAGREK